MILQPSEIEEVQSRLVGKLPKAHGRAIVALQFVFSGHHVALVSVGHDNLKMWTLADMAENDMVVFSETAMFSGWRCGVQAAHITSDGRCAAIVGVDSMIYALTSKEDGDDGQQRLRIRDYDLGYMESWHIRATAPDRFITTSHSGFLSEVIDGAFGRREPAVKIKSVAATALSPSGALIALSNHEGHVEVADAETLKQIGSFEAHAMRIRALLFPTDEHVITGCDDKTIKLFRLLPNGAISPTPDAHFCAHRAPVTALAAPPHAAQCRRFASASANGQVLIWSFDVAASPIASLPTTHEGSVNALAWSFCGQFLVSGGEDKVMAVYRTAAMPYDESAPLLKMTNVPEEEKEEEAEEEVVTRRQDEKENSPPPRFADRDDEAEEEGDGERNETTVRDLFGDDSDDSDEGGRRREGAEEEERRDDERRTPPPEDDDDARAVYRGGEYGSQGSQDDEERPAPEYHGGDYRSQEAQEEDGEREPRPEYQPEYSAGGYEPTPMETSGGEHEERREEEEEEEAYVPTMPIKTEPSSQEDSINIKPEPES